MGIAATQSSTTHPSGARNPRHAPALLALILAVYVALVVVGATHHEMWRDEVRAWSIATAGNSFTAIFGNLHNEGHPPLWYLILRAAAAIARGSRLALPAVAALIATAAVAVFLFRAPFPLWERALFVLGYFPLYEYAVMSRNYGISMLLLFVACAMWRRRREPRYIVAIGIALVLLSQTNIHSAFLAAALALVWMFDIARDARAAGSIRWDGVAAVVLVVTACVACALFVKPDAGATNTDVMRTSPLRLVANALYAMRNPGEYLQSGFFPAASRFGVSASIAADVVLVVIALLLRRRHAMVAAYVAVVVALTGLFSAVYPGGERHQGLLFIFVIALFWIAREKPTPDDASLQGPRAWLLGALFAVHAVGGLRALAIDVREQKSAAAALGVWINEHPEYRDAIVIGEPDANVETIPYYAPNATYIAREGVFRRWTIFTAASASEMSAARLADTAAALHARTGRPVIILIAFPDFLRAPAASHQAGYGHRFSWDSTSRAKITGSSDLLGYFPSIGDERYFAFAYPRRARQ